MRNKMTDDYYIGVKVGVDLAWDAAKKIVLSTEDGGLFDYDVRKSVFGCGNYTALKWYSAPEAIEKIRQYEQEQEKIKVGDEVERGDVRYVVRRIDPNGIHVFNNTSSFYFENGTYKKTGRHFPEIAEILRKMKAGEK